MHEGVGAGEFTEVGGSGGMPMRSSYLAGMTEHDIVRIGPDISPPGQLR